MKTRISSKGQFVLPVELRRKDGIKPGQQFDIERTDRGEYRLIRHESIANNGLTDWPLACPAKGFFVPIQSGSTNML
jgi:AbrB family looped-hinge helix DNA binding protein